MITHLGCAKFVDDNYKKLNEENYKKEDVKVLLNKN